MASGINVQDLEGKKEGSGNVIVPRDFFWDSVALFVLSAIVALTVLDVVTEYIRGSSVQCFLPNGTGEIPGEYVNTFCSGNVPFTQYFPVYIFITGILIGVPHYLWLNQYRGNFEFFFSKVGELNNPTDSDTQSHENIVKLLTSVFATYRQRAIFFLYVIKLILQWLFTAGSIVAAVLLFRNNFQDGFLCPRNKETGGFWPFKEQAFCIYNTLVLISYLRVAYLCLICLLLLCLSWAIFWCFCTHATELGHEHVACFSYTTGLPSKYYVAQLPLPGWDCCNPFRRCILSIVTTIAWFTFHGGPRIRSDLDFMVMQLFRTNSGLGFAFKDIQTSLALKDLLDDDQRRLHIHYMKHVDLTSYDEPCPDSKTSTMRLDVSEKYLKWKFSKEKQKRGVYFEYKQIPQECPLIIPDTLLGAILGYGACAPIPEEETIVDRQQPIFRAPPKSRVMNAISISFDNVGYGTTLARTFNWVGSVNFSSKFDPNTKSPAELTRFYTNMISLVCREDVFCADEDTQAELDEPLRNLWFPAQGDELAYETSFIVLGPIPSDNPGHLTTVDLFLDNIRECLGKAAVLLTLKPVAISGKNVKDDFLGYVPRESRFVKHELIVHLREDATEWKARESAQPIIEPQKAEKEQQKAICEGAALPAQKPKEEVHLLQMEGGDTSESEPESKEMESKHPKHKRHTSDSESKSDASHEHTFDLMCGKTEVTMMFTTYSSVHSDDHYRERRVNFLPHKPEQIDDNVLPPQSPEPSVKGK